MKTIFKIEGTDLASRKTASVLRKKIEDALVEHDCIQLDFSSVYSTSESYSDELLGVLVDYNGLEWLLEHVKISNARVEVLRSISFAIRRRLENKGEIDTSLLVARDALQRKSNNSPR